MIKRFLLLFICLIFVFGASGVYASWLYAEGSPTPVKQDVSVSLSVFNYPPDEILPGGNLEEAILGEDHYYLIDLILNERNKGYGLNISDRVLIHTYLQDHSVIYSNQKISGGNMKFILDPNNNTHKLYYCVEKVSDTEYYAYTFSTDELSTAAGSDVEIVAYRTILVKEDEWIAATSYLGYAKTKSLNALGCSADSHAIAYSIDVSTWHY